jgi:hypothetical protein
MSAAELNRNFATGLHFERPCKLSNGFNVVQVILSPGGAALQVCGSRATPATRGYNDFASSVCFRRLVMLIGAASGIDPFLYDDIEVGLSLRPEHVVAAMNRLKYDRGLPERITTDNGSEFAGAQMDLSAYTNHVRMDFSRRGKPTDNAIVESFNGRFRPRVSGGMPELPLVRIH